MANLKFLRYKTTSEFNTAKTSKPFNQGDVVFDSEAKILYIVTDNTPTLEPYYGNNAIKDVSCNNSEIIATLSDSSTKKITVNNVVNAANANKAASADKATGDGDGNTISTTYVKKLSGTTPAAYYIGSLLNQYGVKIDLPLTWSPQQAAMFAFTVRIYNAYQYTDIVISGYNYGSNHWDLPKAEIIGGTRRYTVKFGWNTEPKTLFIWIGNENTNTAFSWGGLSIFNVHCGHVVYDMSSGWTSSFCSATELEALSTVGGIQATVVPALNAKANGTNASGTWGINITGNAASATTANKTQAALTFGTKTFNGSTAAEVTATDLGLSSALKFLGTTTTVLEDSSTTNPIVIGDASITAQPGNVVLYDHLEFIWNGSSWEELGDEKSFALKSIQIKAGGGLSGGGALTGDVTISHADTSSQASITTGGRTYINSITLDEYGHVTALGTGTETDQTTVSSVPWTGITSKPTTLSGYGITDAVPTYTVNAAQTDLTWIKGIAAKQSSRMSFYYNYNGTEWSYLLGCRNVDADDSLSYGSILKFGYADKYLRMLRIEGKGWKSTDWEKISAGYADTSGACSGNSATATTATTATSTSGLICEDVRGEDRSPDTYFTAKRVTALFNSSISGANNTWNSAIHVHGWTSGYVAWELIGPASDSIGSDNLYWREGINSTWQSVRKILDSSNYNNYAPTLTGIGASGTWGISISGNAGTASTCSGNSNTANKLITSRTLWGQSFDGSGNVDGTIRITPTTGNYTEGIRIKPCSGWTTILLGGTDLSEDTGTSTNSWSLHTYGGNFYLNRNNSSTTTSYILCNVSGNWGMGTNAPAYKLDVQGTLRATGATTLGSSLSVTGDIAASSNVNVTNQTKSKTFNIDGGCTLEYDSTNKCVKFVF